MDWKTKQILGPLGMGLAMWLAMHDHLPLAMAVGCIAGLLLIGDAMRTRRS